MTTGKRAQVEKMRSEFRIQLQTGLPQLFQGPEVFLEKDLKFNSKQRGCDVLSTTTGGRRAAISAALKSYMQNGPQIARVAVYRLLQQ